ncbi:MAG: 50S ribosomal protein L3 [Alphaproteobacteria bacterium]|nr:50S ribosomal protein L3 [Alphaproteobacteria bacterium]
MKRSGLITKKIGMTRLFDDKGVAHGVTVLSVGDCAVIGNRTQSKHGYVAVQVGFQEAKDKHVNKPQLVAAKKEGVKAYRKVVEFRVSEDCLIPVGTAMSAGHFVEGQMIDAQGTSKGKGFQGAMKRHNFAGLEASHGVLKAHRSLGGTGQREWPGRVFKGKKMPGQMGNETVTVQNLKVFGINEEDNLIYVSGSVPGANGTFVLVTDAVKIEHKDLPTPTKSAVTGGQEPVIIGEEVAEAVAEQAEEIATEPVAEELKTEEETSA